jgi:3-phenylpropionate/cinnamic acid dioxygenase small subunit
MDESKLRLLLDRMEIGDTVHRYASGIDMRDWNLYRSCFTDDIELDFSSADPAMPTAIKADEWVNFVRAALGGFESTQHISSNHVITVKGDEAGCVSYMQATHYLPNDRGDNSFTLGGYYTDNLVRTSNGWKIKKRRLTVTWSAGNRSVMELALKQPTGPNRT